MEGHHRVLRRVSCLFHDDTCEFKVDINVSNVTLVDEDCEQFK